jgi:TonB family protein
MSSFRTLRCARPLNLVLLGLTLALVEGYAGNASSPGQQPAGECQPTVLNSHDYHSSLISDLKVPKPVADPVSPPRVIYSVAPVFPAGISDREFSGMVTVAMLLDANGWPQQVHVARSLGPAFDENAVQAVEQYRFKPAILKGKLVPVKVCIEVNFRRN